MDIAQSAEAYSSRFFKSSRAGQSWQPVMVGASYLVNPFTLLTCLGRPTSVFGNLFILLSISKACSGAAVTSIFALALASYTSLYPLLLLPPLVLLCYDKLESRQASKTKNSLTSFAVRQTASLGLSIGILLVLSYALTGSWSFVSSVYSTRLLLPDLTPNVGLWWYFFIEIFDSFRSFFVGVFWLHLASYSPALTIRLREQPLAVLVLLCGIFAIFQPYANVGDAGMWIGMLSLYGHVFERKCNPSTGPQLCRQADTYATVTRYTFPALSALLYTTLLGPAFYYLWIYAGSGNANFFYAITLVWSLALSVIVADLLYAILRDEWEVERPEMKGKEVSRI